MGHQFLAEQWRAGQGHFGSRRCRCWVSTHSRPAPPRLRARRTKRAFTVFNQTDDANRVQDILTALTYLQKSFERQECESGGTRNRRHLEHTLRARWQDRVVSLAADLIQFRADTDQEYLDQVLAFPDCGRREISGLPQCLTRRTNFSSTTWVRSFLPTGSRRVRASRLLWRPSAQLEPARLS